MNQDHLTLAVKVHGELSRLIQPVTPESIKASRIRKNPLLLSFVFGGVISTGIFLLAIVYNLDELYKIIGAAGLGITFQSLYLANKHLKTFTFNPRYNQGYVINYALGILSGTIFGLFGKELLQGNSSAAIGAPLLALVGAYSAEAVAQVLQRVSETLVTMVQGSEKEKSDAKMQKNINQEKAKLTKLLSKAMSEDPKNIKNSIEEILKDLNNPNPNA